MAKIWKVNQRMYKKMVMFNPDTRNESTIELSTIELKDAVDYLTKKGEIKYPIKSYMVAIIYATLINKHYGDPFYETLNDPDLFLGEDSFFKTYDADKETYDSIIKAIEEVDGWTSDSWAAETAHYWWLECTNEGLIRTYAKASSFF